MRRPLTALAVALVAGCGGAGFPVHNGYRSKTAKPWRKPIIVTLDARGEAEVDETVSYPRRERARWFAVDLPSSGELDVEVAASLVGEAATGPGIAFEVLDSGFGVLSKADAEEDDSGDDEKRRTLYELEAGRYYVHVYVQRRVDEADFTLHLAHRSATVTAASGFPAEVAFIGHLPEVPAEDDSPRPAEVKPPPPRHHARPQPGPTALRARIAGVTVSGARTAIKIDRGADDGIAVGWRGEVITRDGKPIPDGQFEVAKVSPREAFASVQARAAAVTTAKYVSLRPR